MCLKRERNIWILRHIQSTIIAASNIEPWQAYIALDNKLNNSHIFYTLKPTLFPH